MSSQLQSGRVGDRLHHLVDRPACHRDENGFVEPVGQVAQHLPDAVPPDRIVLVPFAQTITRRILPGATGGRADPGLASVP